MVRHEAFQHGIAVTDTASVQVKRFVKAIFTVHTKRLQLPEIPHDLHGIAFQHEKARIRRNDLPRPHDRIQSKLRDTKRAILIIHRTVKCKIPALGNTENPFALAVKLALNRRATLHTVSIGQSNVRQ